MIATPARYARGKFAFRSSDDSGFKTTAAQIAEACGARYTNREHAYIVSATQLRNIRRFLAAGWSTTLFGKLIPPGGNLADAMTYREAVRMLKASH